MDKPDNWSKRPIFFAETPSRAPLNGTEWHPGALLARSTASYSSSSDNWGGRRGPVLEAPQVSLTSWEKGNFSEHSKHYTQCKQCKHGKKQRAAPDGKMFASCIGGRWDTRTALQQTCSWGCHQDFLVIPLSLLFQPEIMTCQYFHYQHIENSVKEQNCFCCRFGQPSFFVQNRF